MVYNILKELNVENGSKYKLSVLEKYKSNDLFKRVLLMTYDKVKFTYGINKIPEYNNESETLTLLDALDFLENKLNTRELTGHSAINALKYVLSNLDLDDAYVIERVIGRDLKINLGKSQINKVFSGLITKPPYMRCGVYSNKTASKINFPAIVQLKADGMFQYLIKNGDDITFISRSGEEREFPVLKNIALNLPDKNVYVGELIVKETLSRQESNGLINSDNPPHDKIIMQCWDMISLDEYLDAKHINKDISRQNYKSRFNNLISTFENINSEYFQKIEYKFVSNINEALEITSDWMNSGFEGGVLKDLDNIFKDHTSPTQLKLKLEIDAEVRITGFVEGTKGTKREETFGAISYTNDEGTVMGQCSGFTDEELIKFNNMRNELIGKVMTVKFNDITKSKTNETYALSHPRFIEIRYDKNETDTLSRLFELKEMAMNLII